MPIKIVALVTPKPGEAETILAAASKCAAASRLESGVLQYEVWREVDHGQRIVFNELYVDQAAVDLHIASDHFKAFAGFASGLWAAYPDIVITRAIDLN